MDVMQLRRNLLMQSVSFANGWKVKTYTASADTTKADTTLGAIQTELPSNYRYAIALKHNPTTHDNNAFITCIFLPTKESFHFMRWRNNAYNQNNPAQASLYSYDLILKNGEKVDIIWRTSPLANDVPILPTGWNYAKIQPGVITKAIEMKTALSSVGTFGAMVSVSDIDFNTIPAEENIYCESITIDSSNLIGQYFRIKSGVYNGVSSWTNAYDCKVKETTIIANFYI